MNIFIRATIALAIVLLAIGTVAAFEKTESTQVGYPGVGMDSVKTPEEVAALAEANKAPFALPPAPAGGALSVDAYQNVQVLGHLTTGEMTRLMTSITLWVAPEQGCVYCHAPRRDAEGNLALSADGRPEADPNKMHLDELYTKRVARRMLQMTMHTNSKWTQHVKGTGVTCWTCHRGKPVPEYIWFNSVADASDGRMAGGRAMQNAPTTSVGLASLPRNGFERYFSGEESIRVVGTEALPHKNPQTIKDAEATYGLMMHFSGALGVNCTHCHNSRSMAEWSTSPMPRAQAWYGIRMVRELNNAYMKPLQPEWPDNRLGPSGDGPKINCATCHQGANKPVLGAQMLKDFPSLAAAKPQPAKTVTDAEPSGDAGVADPEATDQASGTDGDEDADMPADDAPADDSDAEDTATP